MNVIFALKSLRKQTESFVEKSVPLFRKLVKFTIFAYFESQQ